ncbi:MAG: flagellar type III secretion system pore protein FliP [Planctomycetaceae bacterium]|jgi:flagellar biosynthetic protein FliP|nr:flagellar type III secretion system pore protein FliP [Planctomycetaceae bacterium]
MLFQFPQTVQPQSNAPLPERQERIGTLYFSKKFLAEHFGKPIFFAALFLGILFAVLGNILDFSQNYSASAQSVLRENENPPLIPPPIVPNQPITSPPPTATPMDQSFQPTEPQEPDAMNLPVPEYIRRGPDFWTSPEGLVPTLQIMLLLTVLTLAPAIVIMTTSFVRIVVVLSILRQAVGTNQLPPSQVITALSLFLTLLIMAPVWQEVYTEAVLPYTERRISLQDATSHAEKPIREFMVKQIAKTGNTDDIWMFMQYIHDVPEPNNWDEIPWRALLPAFMISELKTAFLIGFQIFLPFLILDMVIASVMVSMGMMMLPPAIISLPFKLMLFVLLNGWNLVVNMLLQSFAWGGG